MEQRIGVVEVSTGGEGFVDVTAAVTDWLRQTDAGDGLLTLFVRHTSASLTVQENADPDVLADLVDALRRLAPREGAYRHRVEGPDDMPAHIRAMLTAVSLSVPVRDGTPLLGTWQGIYLIEHRARAHRREIALHFAGTLRALIFNRP